MIEEYGWAIRHVGAGELPGEVVYSYTVGLTALGSAELIVQGMPFDQAQQVLNRAGREIREERPFLANTIVRHLTGEQTPLAFLPVSDTSGLTAVLETYGAVAALQVLWPDPAGAMPWEAGYQHEDYPQPFLGEPPAAWDEDVGSNRPIPESQKIRIKLEIDDGWPPVSIEGLWGSRQPSGNFILNNPPFFAFGLSNGDEVRTETDDRGLLWITERVVRGGHSTIRIIANSATDTPDHLLEEVFLPLGIDGESTPRFRILALDIAPEADVRAAKAVLRAGLDAGRWDYEESDITEEWDRL